MYTFTIQIKKYPPLLLYYYYYLVLVGIFSSSSSFQKNTIFSSLSAHAYVINIYNQVAYNSYPAGFGKEIPRNYHNGAFVNLFLPPKNVPWDLCNVDDFVEGRGGHSQQRQVQDASSSSSLKTNHNRHLQNKEWSDIDTGETVIKPYSSVLLPKDEGTNDDDDDNNDATLVDVSQFIDKCHSRKQKPYYERSIMTYGIQRTSMAMLIMRGGCTFYTKAVNALKLNSYFAIVDAEIQSPSENTTTHVVDMDSSHSRVNGTDNGTTLGIRPKIEYLIVMNHNGHKRSNRTFPIRKDGAEPDLDDIGLVSLGYSNGMHLLCSMVEKNYVDNGGGQDSSSSSSAAGQQESLGTDMYLDSIAFLPLESDQRTSRDWAFPVNIDGMTADHGSMKNKLLLIFIFVTLLFPIARMFLFCCVHHREFQWRRNANGRIIGFTWSRRALELDNGSWIGSFVAGRNGSNGERGPILLSQEGVKKLPMIEFGVDNVQEIVARYRSNDDDDKKNDNDRDDDKDKKRLNEGNNDIDKYDDDGDDDDDDHVESQDIKTEKDLIVAAYDSCITCSICICDFEHGEKLRLLPECGHVFHTECIMPWLTGKKNACPLCQRRVKVSEEDIRQGDDEDVVQQWRIATSLMSGQIQQDRPPVNVSGSFEQSDSLRRDSREDLNSSVSTLDLSSGGPYPQDNNSSSALSSSRRDLTIFP